MKNVFDYAKWLMDNNLDNPRNTFKGNMKLQKLLFFAQLISPAKNKKRLMLVINKNEIDNTLILVNISKVKGKPNCFTYPFNVLIRNFNPPLPISSFTKNEVLKTN